MSFRSTSMRVAAPLLALAVLVGAAVASPAATSARDVATPALEGARSPASMLAEDGTELVVALFSLPGCPYCEVVRRNYLRHLEAQVPGLRVVEYGIGDERAFADAATAATAKPPAKASGKPASAAALAASLGIRMAPTVVFFRGDGDEAAERLVGYGSPDFYGAYLEGRIASALGEKK